ncbi:MAG: polyprenyl synthetase family protein [Desulfobulbales bacterium]|nr:polyprenyl synthetase family protein [Desulfobulbales bacterium]
MINLQIYLKDKRGLVEQAMADLMPGPVNPPAELARHLEAMRHSLFAGGKRVRPILCLAACEAVGGAVSQALPAAVALEYIHTYSLIHDDLPAMDDDELRRGQPTNHILYGEAGAILAGDGLLTLAFELLSGGLPADIEPGARLRIINIIARAAGSLGMVGGQAMDIGAEGREIDIETLREIHSRKTGALITAAVQAGAVIGGASLDQFAALTTYGEKIGLAFQIVDDLLNVEGNAEQLGKAAGSDADRCKATYPAVYGVERTRQLAEETVAGALKALADFDENSAPLRHLASYIISRNK